MKKIIILLMVFVLSSCNDKQVCGKHKDTMSKDSNDYPCYKTSKTIKFQKKNEKNNNAVNAFGLLSNSKC